MKKARTDDPGILQPEVDILRVSQFALKVMLLPIFPLLPLRLLTLPRQ